MIWAFGSYENSSGYTGLEYHGTENMSYPEGWTMTVESDGTVTSYGNVGSSNTS
jgi:hypothetical protein